MSVLITGITGQDGAYLARSFLADEVEVIGIYRPGSDRNFRNLSRVGLYSNGESVSGLRLIPGDVLEIRAISQLLTKHKVDQIFNLAAQSHVGLSFEMPQYSIDVSVKAAADLLHGLFESDRDVRLYQASTSELFGNVAAPQGVSTAFAPESPYAIGKLAAHELIRVYRSSYGIHCSCGILFNHESPLRGELFVTQKIVGGVHEFLKHGQQFSLGNLDSVRDWGSAPEYVEFMRMFLDHKTPIDEICGTGICYSVRDFLEKVLDCAHINYVREGEGLYEKYIDVNRGKIICDVSRKFFRPSEVGYLQADTTSLSRNFGKVPRVTIDEIIADMWEFRGSESVIR